MRWQGYQKNAMSKKSRASLESIEKTNRFSFVNNKELRKELYLALYYVIYLYEEIEDDSYDEHITFFIKHTIIIYVWSMVEWVLFDYVNNYLTNVWDPSKTRKYCNTIEYIEKKNTIIHQSGIDYVMCEKKDKVINFKDNIDFWKLILWARDNKIISDKILDKIDKIRKKRNSVHIAVLISSKWDVKFNDIEKLFSLTKEIFDALSKDTISE